VVSRRDRGVLLAQRLGQRRVALEADRRLVDRQQREHAGRHAQDGDRGAEGEVLGRAREGEALRANGVAVEHRESVAGPWVATGAVSARGRGSSSIPGDWRARSGPRKSVPFDGDPGEVRSACGSAPLPPWYPPTRQHSVVEGRMRPSTTLALPAFVCPGRVWR